MPAAPSRMGVRRRRGNGNGHGDYGAASSDAAAAAAWGQQSSAAVTHHQQQQAYGPSAGLFGAPPASGSGDYGAAPSSGEVVGGSGNGNATNPTARAFADEQASGHHWHAAGAHAAGMNGMNSNVSPYPDVASYSQQPYFYQQTHPSTYNSPWPPPGEGAFQEGEGYQSAGAMPYFPPHATADAGMDGTDGQQHMVQYGQDPASGQPFSYASGNENGVPRSDVPQQASAFLYEDASMHLKIQSLPILENLATQLIHTIAKASFPQIQEIMRANDDEESQAYTTLKSLFDQTRKVYSRETPFIDAIAIQMFQPSQQETIRKANIATFLSSILGAHDVSFFHLNEFFMETFVPLGHRLLKWQGAVYLELKTQTYISALINSDGSPEAMLDELFPLDLDAQILTRHPDAPSLSPSEQDFIDRSRARKSYLLAEESAGETVGELPKKYQWQEFVREFAVSVSKNIDAIMNVPGGSSDRRGNTSQTIRDPLTAPKNSSTTDGTATRKPTAPSSAMRQPWSKAEEDALLSGLEKVAGPHWSQILALYGRGGSVSEVLKDRNQVQLKDKARNLKLFHLKMGNEVPAALRQVTGELRKRGGARARAAMGVEEEGDDGEEMDVERSARGKGSGRRKGKKG
ncbi:TTAGGG repeat binding factor [Saxophila tyrrhenica]|uniref:TTAGGG repeat binding factor n=1 Tax=Saxophila tyrrhenica TaxID=1690608 RepID=A0AAV9P048_9PEZI|nr:TTAGGG repeat binding factor [Saxophila tyrrhenica]